jgi:sugar (pentulose or hexulose) kinase
MLIQARQQRHRESELPQGFAIIVDVGKTLSKVSLWSRDGEMLDRVTRPNAAVELDGVRRLDADGIAQFVRNALAQLGSDTVQYIVPVAHGAAVAALDKGQLVTAPLDYEQALPPELLADYRKARAPFAETGSPALPQGLNLGAQLWWLDRLHPAAMQSATLLPWAQYWAWFLTGAAVSEVTSLGCHSDLWNPAERQFSTLARRTGWAERFAPLTNAGDVVGTLKPEIAARSGLSRQVKVLAGLHDSNAALLAARGCADIADAEATVLSTGTWFVAMRSPQEPINLAALPEARDCLINVDVAGQPVPSARFMGGREVELLGQPFDWPSLDGIAQVLLDDTMVLPSQVPGCGPFPDSAGRLVNWPANPAARHAAVALYLALMADVSLDLIGARDRLLIEGRYAASALFTRALAALRPHARLFTAAAEIDVSFGALRLVLPDLAPRIDLNPVQPLDTDLTAIRAKWHRTIAAFSQGA